jgi:hypothetical protein
MWTRAELVQLVLKRERELISLILERERKVDVPEPPEPEPGSQRPHPMIKITKRIRAEKLRQFRAEIKRRPF